MKSKRNFRLRPALGLFMLLALLISIMTACENKSVGPNPDPILDCERYQTARITFENHSQHSTYDIILDGSNIGEIGNGRSITRTVAAGQHTLIFRFSNTHGIACSESTPNLIVCSDVTYWCSNDE